MTMKTHKTSHCSTSSHPLLLVILLILLDITYIQAFSINTYGSNGILRLDHRRLLTFEQSWSRRQLALRGGAEHVDADSNDDASSSQVNKSNNPSTIRSYYLLWSPGILRTTLLCTLGWFLLDNIKLPILRHLGKQPIIMWLLENTFLLPLLASSCCLLQVIIFSLPFFANGCLGFNSILGPLRPYFMSLLLFWMIRHDVFSLSNPGKLVSRLLLAFLPEILHLWNQRPQKAPTAKGGQGMITLQVNVPSMGCVACINKIDSLLHQPQISHQFQVTKIESSLLQNEKGGKTTIRGIIKESSQQEDVIQLVLETLQSGGFPSTLDSIQ